MMSIEVIDLDVGKGGMLSQALDRYCCDGKILISLKVWNVRIELSYFCIINISGGNCNITIAKM